MQNKTMEATPLRSVPHLDRSANKMITLVTRFFCGCTALVLAWFSTWPFEDGRYSAIILAGISGILLSALASSIAIAFNREKRLYTIVFAIPFAFPAAVSAHVVVDGIFRPFLFWLAVGSIAFLISRATDLLMRRLIRQKKDKPNKAVEPTGVKPLDEVSSTSPVSHL